MGFKLNKLFLIKGTKSDRIHIHLMFSKYTSSPDIFLLLNLKIVTTFSKIYFSRKKVHEDFLRISNQGAGEIW